MAEMIGGFVALAGFVALMLQMPENETYGPPDTCGGGGKFCPNSDPDPKDCPL